MVPSREGITTSKCTYYFVVTAPHKYNVKSYHLNCLNNSPGLSVKGQQTIPQSGVMKILLQNYSTTS